MQRADRTDASGARISGLLLRMMIALIALCLLAVKRLQQYANGLRQSAGGRYQPA